MTFLFVVVIIVSSEAFVLPGAATTTAAPVVSSTVAMSATKKEAPFSNKMTADRRKKLGVADDEDEYDLDVALDNNTDPFITKVVAGSLIVSILSLLVYAIVIPATTDFGNACTPLLTGGRC